MRKRNLVIGVVIIGLMLIFWGLFFGAQITGQFGMQTVAPSESTIKIGLIAPLSGDLAKWGTEMRNGAKLAVSEINAAGGVNGKMIVLLEEDDACDKTKSVTAITKLATIDKVHAIIGPVCSGTVLADASVAEQTKTILLGFGSAMAITNAGDYIFRPTYSDAFQGVFLADEVIRLKVSDSIAVIYANNDYGVGLLKSFSGEIKKQNKSITVSESYETTQTDFQSNLTKIKSVNPKVLVIFSYGSEGAIIAKQAKELGVNAKLFGADNFGTTDNISASNGAMEGAFFSNGVPPSQSNPKVANFVGKYVQSFGSEPTLLMLSTNAYDTVHILSNALRSGEESESIKNFLYAMPAYNGISGVTKFDSFGDATKEFELQTVKNGEIVTYEPN